MLKRLIWVIIAVAFFTVHLPLNQAMAVELNEDVRTVKLNPQGQEMVISLQEAELGKRIFNDTCSQCHLGGRTKTNPNVGLRLEALEGAEPPRDNVVALVDYFKYPMTYDGEEEITLLHPNTERSDIFAEMRNLTDADLKALAGYILIQPKVRGVEWGGGKVYN
ncbi:photosystem II cytochrome c-550 [Gloeocapsa sp. PCC 73106]|uniref:photosystem II cytochrome c-550 n=1 Tax=Gloeocapsa sp. PCC 73106 TaxID=102232 RepID=UPI0002ACC269|nr:photosystem II cytochrome c-550 [Gloeocapsa sp. PCC 73106]ELR98584.1 cytochrome c-550 [Gloeocapsa sp. PCC 73106]